MEHLKEDDLVFYQKWAAELTATWQCTFFLHKNIRVVGTYTNCWLSLKKEITKAESEQQDLEKKENAWYDKARMKSCLHNDKPKGWTNLLSQAKLPAGEVKQEAGSLYTS